MTGRCTERAHSRARWRPRSPCSLPVEGIEGLRAAQLLCTVSPDMQLPVGELKPAIPSSTGGGVGSVDRLTVRSTWHSSNKWKRRPGRWNSPFGGADTSFGRLFRPAGGVSKRSLRTPRVGFTWPPPATTATPPGARPTEFSPLDLPARASTTLPFQRPEASPTKVGRRTSGRAFTAIWWRAARPTHRCAPTATESTASCRPTIRDHLFPDHMWPG